MTKLPLIEGLKKTRQFGEDRRSLFLQKVTRSGTLADREKILSPCLMSTFHALQYCGLGFEGRQCSCLLQGAVVDCTACVSYAAANCEKRV